jgi:hypothetical protein
MKTCGGVGEWSVSRPCRFTPEERATGIHCIGGWMGPKVGLDSVKKRKMWHCRESNAGRPARSPSLSRLPLLEIHVYNRTAVTTVLSAATPCSLADSYQRFGGTCCLHLQGRWIFFPYGLGLVPSPTSSIHLLLGISTFCLPSGLYFNSTLFHVDSSDILDTCNNKY